MLDAGGGDGGLCDRMADTVADLLAAGAASAPALLAPGRAPASHAELRGHVAGVAGSLAALGIGRADRVALALPNGPAAASAFLAVASAAVAAPLNPAGSAEEFDFCLGDLGARALILEAGADSPARGAAARRGVPVFELEEGSGPAGLFALSGPPARTGAEPRPAAPGDTALMLHTSGTTSRPKKVPLTHANLAASARRIAASLALGPGDRCLNVMPLFHIHGLVAAVLASLAAGGSVFCAPGFNALRFFSWLGTAGATWYTAVPTMHQAVLARAPRNPGAAAKAGLRFVRSSSAPLPRTVMAALEAEFAAPVIESYGMTEACHQMTSNPLPPAARKAGTVGVAAGPEVAVMRSDGGFAETGETGEVAVRGPGVTPGYEDNPEANREAFRDGWFRTGDEGVFDADGYLTITGRLKEIINRGGEKVGPREVDERLMEHPAVAQAVTFALPHAVLGEEVAAAVVLREGSQASESELRRFAGARLAAFKTPRRVVFVDEIPKGPTGKLQRIGLARALGLAP